MVKSLIEKKIVELYGERCTEYKKDCVVCRTWRLFDKHQWGALLNNFLEVEQFMKAQPTYQWWDGDDDPTGFDGPTAAN